MADSTALARVRSEDALIERLVAMNDLDYASDTRDYARFLQEKGLPMNFKSLEAYREFLVKGERVDPRTGRRFRLAPRTANRRLAGVKKLYRKMLEADVIQEGGKALTVSERYQAEQALGTIKTLKVPDGIRHEKFLTAEEIEKLIAACSPKIALLVRFLASTGLRISEALGIHQADIKRIGAFNHVTVVGKGGKARTVQCRTELIKEIRAMYKGKTWLFEWKPGKTFSPIYASQRIGFYARKALGRDGVSAHCMRHSFATIFLEREPTELETLSKYLGHSDVGITSTFYLHRQLSPEKAATTVQF